MAEKGFGVKEINLIGASGTPTIESPNNLNLNAVNVAISTNVSIGGTLTVTGNVSVGGTLTYEDVTNIDSVGLITARDGIFIPDNKEVKIGNTASNPDIKIFHQSSSNHSFIDNTTGNLYIRGGGQVISLQATNVSHSVQCNPNSWVKLYNAGSEKLETTSTGITVTGTVVATGADINGDIDVDGHTNLDNVSIAGVATVTGALSANNGISVSGDVLSIAAASDIRFTNSSGTWSGSVPKIQHYSNMLYIVGGTGGIRFREMGTDRWDINGDGHFVPRNDSQLDIGTNTLRVANGYFDTLYGDGSNITGIAVTEAPVTDYTITANGSSAYRFHGGGVDETADDPDLYLIRGQKYRFNNTTGSSHPFAIREASNGSAYSNGVTGSQNGIQFFTVPYDAPAKIFYQCTIHSGMVGNIYIRGANGQNDNVGVTTFSGNVTTGGDILLGAHGSRIFDDSSGTNVVVDIYGGTTAGKRGILALGGRTGSDNADIGTIQFLNENNANATSSSHVQSKLVASIDTKSETTNNNASANSGGHLIFSTKAENAALTERARITSDGYLIKAAGRTCAFNVRGTNMSRTDTSGYICQFNDDTSTGCFDSGNNFNTSTYKFIAPVTGIYYFFTNIRLDQYNTGYIRTAFLSTNYGSGSQYYNYPESGHVISYPTNTSGIMQISTSTVVQLDKDDELYVWQNPNADSSYTVYLSESSFGGYLIG